MRILFFIFFFGFVHSQDHYDAIDNFLYDDKSNLFQIISGDTAYFYDLNKKHVHKQHVIHDSYDIKAVVSILNNSFYPSNETGVVLNKTFNRLDRTATKNFFINSSFLTHNDTLFRVGGYGFWTKYRGVSYYDKSQNAWYAYKLNFIDQEYQGVLNPLVAKIEKNKYIIIAGRTFDDKNPLVEYNNTKIFYLDFNTKSILFAGNILEDLTGVKVLFKNDSSFILQKTSIIKLDWKNNLIQVFSSNWTPRVSNLWDVYLIGNQFYYIEQINGNYKLSSSINTTAQQQASYTSEIVKSKKWKYLLLIFGSCILLILIYNLYQKFNKITVYNTHLTYRFKKIGINEYEYKILSVLAENNKITTNQIHSILNTQDLHPNHIYRLIPEVMRDLGKTLNLLTSKNNLVFSVSKNKTDRRIREYVLNRDFKVRFNK